MDHKEAVRSMAAEKYLLNEFAPEQREEFEEHYFSCHECAQDIVAGAALLEQGRRVLVQDRQRQQTIIPASSSRRDWFAWLRPAFAVPVMALLLLVVGFQNLVQVPKLERSLTSMSTPELLPSTYLASGSARGGDEHAVTVKAGQAFLLLIDVAGPANAAYIAELYDPTGTKKWSLTLPESSPKESLSILMPGNLPSGEYSLVVRKAAATGRGDIDTATYKFDLRRV